MLIPHEIFPRHGNRYILVREKGAISAGCLIKTMIRGKRNHWLSLT